MKTHRFRNLPAVEKVLKALGETGLPRPVVTAVVRRELDTLRREKTFPEFGSILDRIHSALLHFQRLRLQPVINGTGVVLHTNLGRSPLSPAVTEEMAKIATRYSNLELDLDRGERGGRAAYLEHNLALLCQSEAATVVNNCAAALILILRHFTAKRPEVIISRGELVQIGGGFRIPEILEASGARLREVGTTNKTALIDYESAVGPDTGLLLKVHRSNFFMGGFVDSPATEALSGLARRKRIPFVEDLGSGALMDTGQLAGLEHEPTPAEVLKRGVDLVCFSGDKLLGGPQAGIIAGKAKPIGALKRNPFFRALRCDKLVLAALQVTADQYLTLANPNRLAAGIALSPEPPIPLLKMLSSSLASLRVRAETLCQNLSSFPLQAWVGQGKSQVGGGSLPRSTLESVTLEIVPRHFGLEVFSARLRTGDPPIIGYIRDGRFKLDLRTVFPDQDDILVSRLQSNSQPHNP
jgi:L-seryl-tRNA(Ser) seleniumtransferase